MHAASADRIRQSARAVPGGATAWRMRCTRRSQLVKVPSFSVKAAAGSTTSASRAVSLRRSSTTTRKSRACSARNSWFWSGSVTTSSSPITISARSWPRRAASLMASEVNPGKAGAGRPQATEKRACTAGSAAGW